MQKSEKWIVEMVISEIASASGICVILNAETKYPVNITNPS